MSPAETVPRRSREERERIVLDTAAALFYARGVHEVGMDELVRECGLSKPTVYRLFATKDALVGAYLERLRTRILGLVDADRERLAPAAALHAVLDAVAEDLARPGFRGCPFNNAGTEYPEPDHPARRAATRYRADLLERLEGLAEEAAPGVGAVLGRRLAALVDGAYTSAAHLGPHGPARDVLDLGHELVDRAAAGG